MNDYKVTDYIAPDDDENRVISDSDRTSDDAQDSKAALSGKAEHDLDHKDEDTKDLNDWTNEHAPEEDTPNWFINEATEAVMDRLQSTDTLLAETLRSGDGLLSDIKINRSEDVDIVAAAYRSVADETDQATAKEAAGELAQMVFGNLDERITLEQAQERYGYTDRVIHALQKNGVEYLDIIKAADGGEHANFTLSPENNTAAAWSNIAEATGFDARSLVYRPQQMDSLRTEWAEVLYNARGRSEDDQLQLLKDILTDAAALKAASERDQESDNENTDADDYDDADAIITGQATVVDSRSKYPDRQTNAQDEAYFNGYRNNQDEAIDQLPNDQQAAASCGLEAFNAETQDILNVKRANGEGWDDIKTLLDDYRDSSEAISDAIENANGYIVKDVALPDLPASGSGLDPTSFALTVSDILEDIQDATEDQAIDEDERKLLTAVHHIVDATLAKYQDSAHSLGHNPEGAEARINRQQMELEADAILHFLQPKQTGIGQHLRDGIAAAGRVTGQVAVNAAGNVAAGAVVAAI